MKLKSIFKHAAIVLGLVLPGLVSGQQAPLVQGYSEMDLPLIERVLEKNKSESDKLRTMESYYVLLTCAVGRQDKDLFDKYVDEAVDLGEELLKNDETKGIASAYLGGIYGLKIAFSPMMAMFHGPRAGSYCDRALELSPDDPDVLMMYAINKYNTPEAFGGDVDLAIKSLKLAAEKYERSESQNTKWQYLHTLVWLGMAYEKQNDLATALECYEKSLEYSPSFKWAKSLVGKISN